MELENKKVWVIMTKCRKYIAKGTVRNRVLISVDNHDKKRFLTYSSKKKAESAMSCGFSTYKLKDFPYNVHNLKPKEYLDAVECQMILMY